MERKEKPVQFPMDEHAYEMLKQRAKTLGISTGRLVENLLASLELRLVRAYEKSNIGPEDKCEKSDRLMIQTILKADESGDSDNWEIGKFKSAFTRIRSKVVCDSAAKLLWTPSIDLGDEDK